MKTDLQHVFCFPLIPVPLSLADVTGSTHKAMKSKLLAHLEAKVAKVIIKPKYDVYIVDAMLTVRAVTPRPLTYAAVAKAVLKMITYAPIVYFVCDEYRNPSIKDVERETRGMSFVFVQITGANQRCPADYMQLCSSVFKTSLLHFLLAERSSQKYMEIINGHTIYFCIEQFIYRINAVGGEVLRTRMPGAECKHEEAHTRIIYHLHEISQCKKEDERNRAQMSTREGTTFQARQINAVVRTDDTDVLVLLTHYIAYFTNVNVFMGAGKSSNNNRRLIDISQLAAVLGSNVCKALRGIHAFGGCDFTAAMYYQGKGEIFELACGKKKDVYLKAFEALGEGQEVSSNSKDALESFTCDLYGQTSTENVNTARCQMYNKKYRPSVKEKPLDKIKGMDASRVLPCKEVLLLKIARDNYVCYLWKHAH